MLVEDLIRNGRDRARSRRSLFCRPEDLLESALETQQKTTGARAVREHLALQISLPFTPSRVDLSEKARALVEELDSQATDVAPEIVERCITQPRWIDAHLRERLEDLISPDGRHEPIEADSGADSELPTGFSRVAGSVDEAWLVPRPALEEQVLLRLLAGNVLIVGEPGSGRRSLLRLVQNRLIRDDRPDVFRNLDLLKLSPLALLGGTAHRGELEERLGNVARFLKTRTGSVVIFVDDLVTLIGRDPGSSQIDVFSALAPAMEASRVGMVAVVNQSAMREHVERRPELLEMSSTLRMPELGRDEAAPLIEGYSSWVSRALGVQVGKDLLVEAVTLAARYLPHKPHLGASCNLLKGAAARARFTESSRDKGSGHSDDPPLLSRDLLLTTLSEEHGFAIQHLSESPREKLDLFSRVFEAEIFGQDLARESIYRSIKTSLTGLSQPGRPRGRLFFFGPPGTGKTESARLVSRCLMGDDRSLLRFNMSEFSQESSISTLKGSDRGLVGSEQGGRLTEPMREMPHRVVLFDEVEKACPAVWQLFLQVLEDGWIEDTQGRPVSFRHSICIFTSNVGADDLGVEGHVPGRDEIESRLRDAGFTNEFNDRIETFIPFRCLDAKARTAICRLQLRGLAKQVQELHRSQLSWSDEVVALGAAAEERLPGARGILRWLEHTVKPLVADAMLAGRPGDAVELIVTDGRLDCRNGG